MRHVFSSKIWNMPSKNTINLFFVKLIHTFIITVVAWILNIQNQNPFKIHTIWCSDLGWFVIRMIRTIATAIVPTIKKRTSTKESKMAAIWSDLDWSGCSILECHLKSEPFYIRTTFDHLKTKCVGILAFFSFLFAVTMFFKNLAFKKFCNVGG